jgi:hypothetical protein
MACISRVSSELGACASNWAGTITSQECVSCLAINTSYSIVNSCASTTAWGTECVSRSSSCC